MSLLADEDSCSIRVHCREDIGKCKYCIMNKFLTLRRAKFWAEAFRTTVLSISILIRTTVLPITPLIGTTVVRIRILIGTTGTCDFSKLNYALFSILMVSCFFFNYVL